MKASDDVDIAFEVTGNLYYGGGIIKASIIVKKDGKIKPDNDYKAVVNAGGEILERYRQHRGKFNQTKYADLEMDKHGRLNGDLH